MSDSEHPKIDPAVIRRVEGCIDNARELQRAATTSLAAKHYNVAYHLAVLSLEEVGKAGLIGANAIRSKADNPKDDWLKDKLADHAFKLFWAFWTVESSFEKLLPDSFKDAQAMGKSIHKLRMDGLYAAEDGVKPITKEQAESMVKMAEARLALDNSADALTKIRPEGLDDLSWFIKAMDDPELRPYIFSKEAFTEYSKVGDIPSWTKWLRGWIAEEQLKMQQMLKAEMEREYPAKEEQFEAKWKVRFKLVSSGVTILSTPVFNEWNKRVDRVKFTVVKDHKEKGELIVDLILPKVIHLQHVYEVAHQEMIRVILMLNIATFGFFWWYSLLPYINKFEFIEDLEKKQRIGMEAQNPYVHVWKKNESRRKMTMDDVDRMLWCYLSLPRVDEPIGRTHFGYYMRAMVMYSKHESELPLLINAGMDFLTCLYESFRAYGEIETRSDMSKLFFERFGDMLDEEDTANFKAVLDPYSAGDDPGAAKMMKSDITTKLKIFCDQYLLKQFKSGLPARMKEMESSLDELDSLEEQLAGNLDISELSKLRPGGKADYYLHHPIADEKDEEMDEAYPV